MPFSSESYTDHNDFLSGLSLLMHDHPDRQCFSLQEIASAANRPDTYPYRAQGIARVMVREGLIEQVDDDHYRITTLGLDDLAEEKDSVIA